MRRLGSREGAGAVLIWGVAAWSLLPRLVQSVSAPKVRSSVGVDNVSYTPIAAVSVRLTSYALLALVLVLVAAQVRRLPRSRFLLLGLMLLPWAIQIIRDMYLPLHPSRNDFVYPLVILTVWMIRPRVGTLRHLGYISIAVAVASLLIGVLYPASGIFRSTNGDFISEDKQILPMGILIGIFTQGNNLAQFLVLGGPALVFAKHRLTKVVGWALISFTMVWSASRSGLIALVALTMIALVIGVAVHRARMLTSITAMVVVVAAVVVLPLVTDDPTAFTNRGYIWTQSLRLSAGHRTFGMGSNWYSALAKTSGGLGPTVFHAHNEFLQLLVTGGVLLVLAVAVQFCAIAVRALALLSRGSSYGVLQLVTLGVTCTTEIALVYVDNFMLAAVVVIPIAYIAFGESEPIVRPSVTRQAGASLSWPTDSIGEVIHVPLRQNGKTAACGDDVAVRESYLIKMGGSQKHE